MRLSEIALPCGARLTVEQEDVYGGLYSPAWLSPVPSRVRCRLDRLPVTVSEARALVEHSSGRPWDGMTGSRYWGSITVSHQYGGSLTISGIELTEDEARAIADGADPLTVLGVYPARVVLSIVRLPADG